ncbi:5-methylcytosine restriction system specificity protein McrC [Paenibacillus sp. FSL R10-2748]|uniref:5-methylcytosine restriction system specificity protein McrC n=1 Tax=Paenibacillus sp. FSL R10-2748 TaxID=2954658 RepID=UPI0030F657B9
MEWIAKESSTTYLKDFRIELLPNSIPSQIRFIKNKGRIGIEVGNVVGLLPLEGGNSIRILPKYTGINIVEMMLYVQGLTNKHNENKIGEQFEIGNNIPQAELFVQVFLRELRIIEERSIKFERRKEQQQSSYAKGSVNWSKTKLNIMQKKNRPIETKSYVQDFNISENHLLAAAAAKAINYIEKYSSDWNLLNKWIQRFSYNEVSKLFRTIDRKLVQDRITGARAYYRNAIISAKIILGYYGVDLGEDVEGDALLVNTPDLYEEYIRAGCGNSLREHGIHITKNFSPPEYLFTNGTCELIPDIVFNKGNTLLLVGDVKYKEPDSKDYYQLYSYIKKAGLGTGIVFTPSKNGEQEPTVKTRSTFDNVIIYDICVPTTDSRSLENTIKLLYDERIIPHYK